MCDKRSLRSACAYPQSDQSLCKSLENSMTAKLQNKNHLELLRLKALLEIIWPGSYVMFTVILSWNFSKGKLPPSNLKGILKKAPAKKGKNYF